MTEDLRLHPSNACPACGSEDPALVQEEGPCCACTRTFRAGHRVRFNHRLGTLHALTEQDAVDALCVLHDPPVDRDPADYFGDDIQKYVEEHLRFEYDPDQSRFGLHTILPKTDPGLVHESVWTVPPLGPNHPLFEDTLDIIRKFGTARAKAASLEARLDEAKEQEREAWRRVRPALKKLIEHARGDGAGD